MTLQKHSFPALPINSLSDITRNWEFLLKLINTEWTEPTLEHGWKNFEAGARTAQYVKDLMGFVHLRGVLKEGEENKPAFTLPVEFRPGFQETFIVASEKSNASCEVTVTTAGTVTAAGAGAKVYFFLDGITFRAEKEN